MPMTADELFDQLVRPLPAAEQLRLLGRIADELAGPRGGRTGSQYADVISGIRARQRSRGYRPPTADEANADITRERAGWDE